MKLSDVTLRRVRLLTSRKNLRTAVAFTCMWLLRGGKLWRMDYRFEGKRKTLSFGAYPAVGLKDARARREEAKGQIAAGIDPGAYRKAAKEAARADTDSTFEIVAREWFDRQKDGWAESHAGKIMARLERDIFPVVGGRPHPTRFCLMQTQQSQTERFETVVFVLRRRRFVTSFRIYASRAGRSR